jgi:hypothetical protein
LKNKKFNDIQARLKEVFIKGYNHPQAEELAFFVAQAIRDVPTLLRLLNAQEKYSNEEIIDAVHNVVANHHALSEANQILTSVTE